MIENVAQYRILERLGTAAIGDAFRARDSHVGRTVVLTLLADALVAESDRFAQFRAQASAAAALSHPNIAALYELGEDRGRVFLATEFTPGETLRMALAGGAMHPRRAIDLAAQMADALAEGHAHRIVHRHLTPATVIVTTKGRAKVLDFGLALDAGAPEPDERDDIRALGAVLFEMLTGAAPEATEKAPPTDVDGMLRKMMADDRDARYQSAAAVAADLREIAALLESRRSASERLT